jgi:hypothetical protein
MTITTRDQLINALANNSSRIILDKASIANQTIGRMCSMWRATGFPGQAAIPTTAAVPTSATTGAISFTNQTAPATSYVGVLDLISGNNSMSWEIHDRLAHIGGFVLNVTTSQTVTGFNLDTLAPAAARIGAADYTDTQCWLEVYADGGATASNATINVTYNDNTSGNLNNVAVGGTIRAGNMFALDQFIPVGSQGKKIKAINSVILSASTTVAGNFGFTFTRPRAYMSTPLANLTAGKDWAQLGLPNVPNDSCLFFTVIPSTTSSGTLRGGGKIIHG